MKQVLLVVLIMLAVGSAAAMSVDEAKAFMTESQAKPPRIPLPKK